MSRLIYLSLLILTTFGSSVLANNAFAGCFNSLPSATTLISNITSGDACDASCPNNKHSFYQKSSRNCYCTDRYPSESSFQTGTVNNCASPTYYDARIVNTTFVWDTTCYGSAPSGVTFTQLTGPDTCHKNCASYTMAIFYVNTNGYYYCGCTNSASFATTATCGPGAYFSYYHTAAQASQGLSRRKRLAAEMKRNAPKLPCPQDLTACLVGDSSQAYECVDTSSELEACGGCMNGVFGYGNSTKGVDCTSNGAKLGATTCRNGQCIIYGCQPGYQLINKHCLPKPKQRKEQGNFDIYAKDKLKRRSKGLF